MKKTILFIALALSSVLFCANSTINSDGDVKLQATNKTIDGEKFFNWNNAKSLGKIPSIWQWLRLFGEDCEEGDEDFLRKFYYPDTKLTPRLLKTRGWEFVNEGQEGAALVHKAKGISLPLAGYNGGTDQGSRGYYWSSTQNGSRDAWSLHLDSGAGLHVTSSHKSLSFSVRCVQN